ncbi:hypothetical protein SSP24_06320 [Streptomyces spinoverrucosus]|uniref:Uncharacterized protein n=1 Tax=Streptomyces spinoverrucosus TaxID=284043 RepID=A0A4Y3V7P2_9ACTN|nr:hypothetical protein [Streptomyces spinoverrucosus]GEC02977.1 hypothetical protein SSP24_06320 [Streptomyces spinoverrucosus]GHB39142.1 hypothetical protein GCM10010397_06270 [Streptomyces spinoverrucosus]
MPYPTPRPPAPNGPGHCPRCLRPVIWCVTSHQNTQAVDRDRNEDGNQAVRQDHTGRWLVRQLTRERPTPEAGENLHMPHVATCPVPAPRRAPAPRVPRGRLGVRPIRRWGR